MDNEYKPHSLEWTDEKVSRFWNFYNNYKPYDGTWFTEVFGKLILKLTGTKTEIKGKVLDYGAGQGFLLKYLIEDYKDIELYACDFTDSVARGTQERFGKYDNFKGCLHITSLPTVYENNYFDVVFLIETIEHLTDNYLHSTLQEIHRILKPGGTIVITTPNDENIQRNYVHCADCGATFHHMQHVRSWNEKSLLSIMNQFGYSFRLCKGLNLKWYSKKGVLHHLTDFMKNMFVHNKPENLVYIGKKV